MADAGSGTVPTTFADAMEIDLSKIPRCGKKALMTVSRRGYGHCHWCRLWDNVPDAAVPCRLRCVVAFVAWGGGTR